MSDDMYDDDDDDDDEGHDGNEGDDGGDESGPLAVEILGLQIVASEGLSIVLLGRLDSTDRVLPIFIGPAEAQAIGLALEGVAPPRPFTHDLFVESLDAAGARIIGLLITSIDRNTFVAELRLATADGERRVDARPSDGLALAVRVGAPVRVDRRVFDAASVAIVHDRADTFTDDEINRIVSEFRGFIDSADPSDFAPPREPTDEP